MGKRPDWYGEYFGGCNEDGEDEEDVERELPKGLRGRRDNAESGDGGDKKAVMIGIKEDRIDCESVCVN